jgi:farnesyl diphosphate synthase/geranylgeranyl diphosphate synthase type II
MTEARTGFDLKGFLGREKIRVETALESALHNLLPRIPEPFQGAVEHGVTSGGKRLRPILCVAGYRAAGGEGEEIYPLAVSLELIHAYSLMHDDLPCMDDADLRRGEGGGMVGGQLLDLLGEERKLSAEELDELHRLKTGALLRASLTMGGLAAGAPSRALSGLDRYGRAIGLAFQIADDILDATSSAEDLGKIPSDGELGKSTYVSLFGLEEAGTRAGALVSEALSALREGGLPSPELEALARYVVERKR